MNSQCSIQEIAELNNAAASALAVGDAATAMKSLKAALVSLAHIAPTAELNKANQCCFQPAAVVAGLYDPYFFIYNRAFVLDASSQNDMTLVNIFVLFNLALTFHQRGQASGESAKLLKAIRLYDLAIQMVLETSPHLAALALAALNNQAHIFYSVTEYTMSSERLERVIECADFLADEQCSTILPEDMDEIFLNVTIVQPPTMAPSA